MNTIIFATSNEGKMREVRELLSDLPFVVLSMKDAGIRVEIDENGTTFEENAAIKARTVAACIDEEKRAKEGWDNVIVLADDSGLEVDYLDKAPGIYSARFMGENTSYDIKNNWIINKLDGVPDEKRTARFVCAIAGAFSDGTEKIVRGTIEGIIGYKQAGENGFGYDPIFFLPEYGCTTAELLPDEKNKISHRGRALGKMKEIIRNCGIL